MSRSLGTLTVDLLLKNGAFDAGMGRSARVTEKEAARMRKAIKDAVDDMAGEIPVIGRLADAIKNPWMAAGAVVGAVSTAMVGSAVAVGAAMRRSINDMDDMSKAAARVQMPTEEFSKLVYAGSLADVQMDALTKTLGKLTQNSAAALDQSSEQAKMFKALGIQVTDTNGKLRSNADLLADFADAYVRMGKSPEVAAAGFKLFGKSFQEIIPLLLGGSEGLRDAGKQAEVFGIVLDTVAGRQAEEFNDNLTRLQTQLRGTSQTMTGEALPALVALSNEANDMAQDVLPAFKDAGQALAPVLLTMANNADFLARSIKSVVIVAMSAHEQLTGLTEIGAQVMTLGNAPGTIKGGVNRIRGGMDTAAGMLSDTWRPRMLGDRLMNPDFAPVFITGGADSGAIPESAYQQSLVTAQMEEEIERLQEALAAALAGGGSKGKAKAGKDPAKELERIAAEQKRWREEVERTAAQLAGPLKVAEVEHAQRMAAIEDAYKSGRMTLETYNEAKAAEVQKFERSRAEIERSQDVMGQLHADYEEQIRLAGMSNQEYEIEVELLARINDAKRKGVDISDDTREAMRRDIALGQQRLRQIEEMQQGADDVSRAWQQAGASIADAFGDWIGSGLQDTKDFASQVKSIFRRLVSDLASIMANQALTRWAASLTGNGGGMGGFWQSVFTQWAGGASGGGLNIGSLLSMFTGGGASAASGAGGNLSSLLGFTSSLGSGAAGTGATGAAGAGSTGAAGALGAVGWIAAIVAGMYMNSVWWKQGWRAEGQKNDIMRATGDFAARDPVLGGMLWIANSSVMMGHNLLRALGVNDKWASIISGSSGIARAWGHKKPEVKGTGIVGNVGFGGFDGQSYADIKQRGGWFRSDRRWTQYGAIDGTVDRAFDSVSGALRSRALDMARMLGVDITAALNAVKIDIGKLQLDKDPEKARQQIQDKLEEVAEKLSAETIKALGFARLLDDGFMASEQLNALTVSIGLVSGSAEDLGRALTALEKENIARAVEWFEAQSIKDGTSLTDTVSRVTGQLSSYAGLISDVDTQIKTRGMNQFQQAQLQIELQYRSQVKQANDLAKALGLSGARAEDLAKIEQLRALGMADLQRQMEQAQSAWLTDLSLSDLSPLTDAEKLGTALGELRKAVGAGDLQGAQQYAQQALQLGRGLYASGSDYNALYSEVTGLVGQVTASGLMGFTDTQLRIIADGITTLPEDIARAMFALLYKPVTTLPPPVITPPPPIGQGGNGPGGGGGPPGGGGDLRDVHVTMRKVEALLTDIATTNRRMMTTDEAEAMRTIGAAR